MPPAPALAVHEVVKRFDGITAVDGVSFDVAAGTVFGLLGPNGAGKTTIIRILLGILGADSGTCTYQGAPIDGQARRRFGYLPEERGLYQKTRLKETLVYLARLRGLSPADANSQVDSHLERFDLQEYGQKPIQALSKGNQQKVQFIAAVAHRPSLVVLDEPFAGLDPVNQLALKELLRELLAEGTTILLSTHRMEQVEQLCQAICLINRGRVSSVMNAGRVAISLLHRTFSKVRRNGDPLPADPPGDQPEHRAQTWDH